MRSLLYLLLLPLLATCTLGHIYGVSPKSAKYVAKAHTKFTVTFLTSETIDQVEDLAAVFGIQPTIDYVQPNGLGTPIDVVNLYALGDAGTRNGNFTVSIPLPDSAFDNGNGNYTLTIGVVTAAGAAFSTGIGFFNISLTTTVK